jgi:hypothetical protein
LLILSVRQLDASGGHRHADLLGEMDDHCASDLLPRPDGQAPRLGLRTFDAVRFESGRLILG